MGKRKSLFSYINTVDNSNDIVCTMRPYQLDFIEQFKKSKYGIVCWARRLGKDYMGLHIAVDQCLEKENSLVYYILPTAKQARLVIAEGKTEEGKPIITSIVNEKLLNITRSGRIVHYDNTIRFKNGSTIVLHGADSDDLVGTNVDLVVVSEGALANISNIVEYLIPSVIKIGGNVLLISTPRLGSVFNDLATNENRYYKSIISADSELAIDENNNRVYTEVQLEEARSLMSEEKFNQEYKCDMKQHNELSIYGNSLKNAKYIEEFQVYRNDNIFCFFDLGIRDLTSIFFAVLRNNKLIVFDHYMSHNQPTQHYIDIIKKVATIQKRNLTQMRVVLPHDGNKRMDTGVALVNRASHYREAKLHTTVQSPVPIKDSIEVTRACIQNRDIVFVNNKVLDKALLYVKKYEFRSDKSGKSLNVPHHGTTGYSDVADSLETGAVALFYNKYIKKVKKEKVEVFDYVR